MSDVLTEGTVFDLTAYLPDSFIPQYEEIKETLVSLMAKLGIVHGDDTASSKEHVDLGELSTDFVVQLTLLVHVKAF